MVPADPVRLVPLRRPPLSAQTLVERWRRLPAVDPERLARDIDQVLDPTL